MQSTSNVPTVSVVIPAYNRSATIARAVQSVLQQSWSDLEVIVVDDGSTDGTRDIVAGLNDPRVRLIRHLTNRGGSAARNTGIRMGCSEFVGFLDSDDEWLPEKLERHLDVFAQGGDRLALVYTGAERLFEDGTKEIYVPRVHRNLLRALLTENVIGETSLAVIRRSALEEVDGFDEHLPASQDLDLWVRLTKLYRCEFVPEPLVRIAKSEDPGRITRNIRGVIESRERFARKHRPEMIRQRVLHKYIRETGWFCHREARDRRLARVYYWRAITSNPFAPLTYILLFVSYVPLMCLDIIAKCRNLVVGFACNIRDTARSVIRVPHSPENRMGRAR